MPALHGSLGSMPSRVPNAMNTWPDTSSASTRGYVNDPRGSSRGNSPGTYNFGGAFLPKMTQTTRAKGQGDGGESNQDVQVKNTFLHVDSEAEDPMGIPRSVSAPSVWSKRIGAVRVGSSMDAARDEPLKVVREDTDDVFVIPEQCPPGVPSRGSVLHGTGRCRPCAWFWKAQSCSNKEDCGYCHLCPEGELKNRKKTKVAQLRMGALAAQTSASPGAAPRVLKIGPLLQQ